MRLEIRDAAPADALALVCLLAQLGYPTTEADVVRRVRRLASSGTDETLVAVRDSKVVGMAAIHMSLTITDESPAAKLSALVVDELHRHQGIGEALVSAVEERARTNGCFLLFLTSARYRHGAHAFYRQLGFEESGLRFAKPLSS